MSIRLNKALRELNIGLQAAVDYLEKRNDLGRIEAMPSFKLSDKQFEALKELKATNVIIWNKNDCAFTSDAQNNVDILINHGWDNMRNDTFIEFNNILVFIPQNINSNLKYWNKSDILNNCPEAYNKEGKLNIAKLCPPTGLYPIIPINKGNYSKTETDKNKVCQAETYQQNGTGHRVSSSSKSNFVNKRTNNVFSLKSEKHLTASEPKVLGKIDLSALNEATRPNKNRVKNNRYNQASIKDIWQKFIDIQEQLIRQQSLPISIIPQSVEIDNGKIYATVDESQDQEQINHILKDELGTIEYNFEEGFVKIPEDKWYNIDSTRLTSICQTLSASYVDLDTTPSIRATIDYAEGKKKLDKLSLEEIKDTNDFLSKSLYIDGHVDDKVAFISKVSVNIEEYGKYLFGDNFITKDCWQEGKNKTIEIYNAVYHNKFLAWDTYQKYKHLGLNCKQYILKFKIDNEPANKFIRELFDCYNYQTNFYEFKRSYTDESDIREDFLQEIYDNIDAFTNEASVFCNISDITVDITFIYSISKRQLLLSKFSEIDDYLRGKEGFSFNSITGAIGIDFNWKMQDIHSIIKKIENDITCININVHDNHRFKCNVCLNLTSFGNIKDMLEDKYEKVEVKNDNVNHKVYINLPYKDQEAYDVLLASLKKDLQKLNIGSAKISIENKENGVIKLPICYNTESRLEDKADSISDLKGTDFGINIDDKDIFFGSLYKVNYPNLVFDLKVDNSNKEAVTKAFESQSVNYIVPILTGDLEKITRLKDTFTKANFGTELVNPRLQQFIFNSAEATKTDDINFLVSPNSPVYKDLCHHLLNTRVNESQIEAIIKAMYAEDLAVIQGPPGTGKSTAIAELIWQLIRKGLKPGNKRERILLTSETNLAVDNAIARIVNSNNNLVKPIRFGDMDKLETEGLQFSLELMKRWKDFGNGGIIDNDNEKSFDPNSLILNNWLSNISKRSFKNSNGNRDIITMWQNILKSPSKEIRDIVFKRYIEGVNVIGATCSSIGDKRAGNNGVTSFFRNYCEVFKLPLNKGRIKFTTVIQDESSKATPAELVLPFVYGKRAIVIGDHRQLPPMLDKEEFDIALAYAKKTAKNEQEEQNINKLQAYVKKNFKEMEISHFQRLYENIDDSLKGTFNLQYRMHPDINEVIEQFYREDGGLKCGLTFPIDLGVNNPDMTSPVSRYHGINIPGLISPNTHVLFINTNSPEMQDGTSRVNYGEVETIDKLLTKFETSDSFGQYLSCFTKEEDKQIGIISFYGKQIRQLKAVAYAHNNLPIRVSTVDRFQGMERNIVIVSMVRSNSIQNTKGQEPDWKNYPETGYKKQEALGFAESPNRLNVALSRAKRLLIIVGNRELFSSKETYRRLFLTIESNKNDKIINQSEI